MREPLPIAEGKLDFQSLRVLNAEFGLRIGCHIVKVRHHRCLDHITISIANVFSGYIYEASVVKTLADELILDFLWFSEVQRETRIVAWDRIHIVR